MPVRAGGTACPQLRRKPSVPLRAGLHRNVSRDPEVVVFHTAFLFVIGGAKCIKASTADQPERPAWLCENGDGETSALVLATRELEDMPKWAQGTAIANDSQRFLANAKQKATDGSWWKPWTHQLLVDVGTSRTGTGARERQFAKAAVAAQRTSTWGKARGGVGA